MLERNQLFKVTKFLFRPSRSAIFLFILLVGLGVALVQTSLSLIGLTGRVATMSANAAMATAKHKKQMIKAISR